VIFNVLKPPGAVTDAVTEAVWPILPLKVVEERVTVGFGKVSSLSLQEFIVRTADASKPTEKRYIILLYFMM